ncbi:hypothetical protein D3C80_1878350 [compost metagenome]
MPPAIDARKHRPLGYLGHFDPVEIGLHRTQARQRWCAKGLALVVTIALAPGQKQLHALPASRLDVIDPQPA